MTEPKHGCAKRGHKTPEYLVWVEMRARCSNPNHRKYSSYGGRGILVCERWDDFANFIADMGERPSPTHMLERDKNDLGYSPGNCSWATNKEQANNRRSNLKIEVQGEILNLGQAVEKYGNGIRYGLALRRYHQGLSAEAILGLTL